MNYTGKQVLCIYSSSHRGNISHTDDIDDTTAQHVISNSILHELPQHSPGSCYITYISQGTASAHQV